MQAICRKHAKLGCYGTSASLCKRTSHTRMEMDFLICSCNLAKSPSNGYCQSCKRKIPSLSKYRIFFHTFANNQNSQALQTILLKISIYGRIFCIGSKCIAPQNQCQVSVLFSEVQSPGGIHSPKLLACSPLTIQCAHQKTFLLRKKDQMMVLWLCSFTVSKIFFSPNCQVYQCSK